MKRKKPHQRNLERLRRLEREVVSVVGAYPVRCDIHVDALHKPWVVCEHVAEKAAPVRRCGRVLCDDFAGEVLCSECLEHASGHGAHHSRFVVYCGWCAIDSYGPTTDAFSPVRAGHFD